MPRPPSPSPDPFRVPSPDAAEPGSDGAAPFVTLAVPVLNEEHYVGPCLESLLHQWPAERFEILVLDGGSTDSTREIVNAIAVGAPWVRLVDNPDRLQSRR